MNRQEELLMEEGEEVEVVELKDRQQQETERKLQHHSCLTLMEHMLASSKVCNLKVCM